MLTAVLALTAMAASAGQAYAHTGFVEVCKKDAGTGLTGNFQFSIEGNTYTVPVGACSPPIQVSADQPLVITELARANTRLVRVTTSPADRLISFDLATRTATVRVVAGDISAQVLVTFENERVETGLFSVCKQLEGSVVEEDFQFTVAGRTFTVRTLATGGPACSPALELPAGDVVVIEAGRPGFDLIGVRTEPADRLIDFDPVARRAIVRIVAGTQVTLFATNRVVPPGQLKICKVAGTGILEGTLFTFTVLPGGATYTVPAGPAPGGFCVPDGEFPVGTRVTVQETIPSGVDVASIDVAPAGRLVGLPDLAAGRVEVTIGTGFTEVTFTNKEEPRVTCVRTQGFFKNHEEALPSTLTIGGTTLTRAQLVAILRTPVRGNGAISLLHQLIAALANAAAGATPTSSVQTAINSAQALLSGCITVTGGEVSVCQKDPSVTSELNDILTAFNEGRAPGGPPHCDD